MSSTAREQINEILIQTLGISRAYVEQKNPPLLDAVAELDSASVLSVLMAIEEQFAILIPDEAISADHFMDIASLEAFVLSQLEGG